MNSILYVYLRKLNTKLVIAEDFKYILVMVIITRILDFMFHNACITGSG